MFPSLSRYIILFYDQNTCHQLSLYISTNSIISILDNSHSLKINHTKWFDLLLRLCSTLNSSTPPTLCLHWTMKTLCEVAISECSPVTMNRGDTHLVSCLCYFKCMKSNIYQYFSQYLMYKQMNHYVSWSKYRYSGYVAFRSCSHAWSQTGVEEPTT